MARLLSVNVEGTHGAARQSAKNPVQGGCRVSRLNLDGDGQAEGEQLYESEGVRR